MPIDNLPGILTTTTRDKERDRWLRDYEFHCPTDSVAPGGQPYIQASTVADHMMPLYSDAAKLALAQDPRQVSGAQLLTMLSPLIGEKLGAIGASGAVTIGASTGGTQIFRGDELIINNLRYRATETKLYQSGQIVPIEGIDTGPQTNQRAGTAAKWSNPRPGCVMTCTVTSQQDGSGLTGGHDAETDDQYRTRGLQAMRNPPGGGNDAQVRALAEDQSKHGVAVQRAFTYPAILGTGSTAIALVMSGDSLGASRIPTSTQVATVVSYVTGQLPPDAVFAASTLSYPVDLTFRIQWGRNAPGWVDLVPWPSYPADPDTSILDQAIVVQLSTSSLNFVLKTKNNNYAGVAPPVAGKRIAFYDAANATFVRKTINNVVGTGPWGVNCETSNLASDTAYTPLVGQRVSPWSDSLARDKYSTEAHVVRNVLQYFANLGPGEQVNTFFDQGWRQRRQPLASPTQWPNVLTSAALTAAASIDDIVADVIPIEPTLPYATPVGWQGTVSYLLQLRSMAFLPI